MGFARRLCGRLLPALPILAGLALVLLALDAWARPGGGQSYSSPGRGSGGGGGSGDGGNIFGLVIFLLIRHPTVGVPVLLIVGGFVLYVRRQRAKHPDWSQGGPVALRTIVGSLAGGALDAGVGRRFAAPTSLRRRMVEVLRPLDPDFSVISFEDFVYALYARAHALRGAGNLDAISAYIAPGARERFARGSEALARVESIVVGDMQIQEVVPPGPPEVQNPFVSVSVAFEANYTEVEKSGAEQAYWVRERWTLRRHQDARTKPPESISVERCPSCGAALESHAQSGSCSYCGNRVDTGTFDWVVEQIIPLARERRGPQLTGTVAERGTQLPTIYQPDMAEAVAQLRAKDPALDIDGLKDRVGLIHRRTNAAWTKRRWEDARPFLSDALFRMQVAWIETYRREKLTNVLEDVRLDAAELVVATQDRWYDAVTFRLFAKSKDYTVRDDTGEVVSGDPREDRAYSEYWTLIRRGETRGPAKADERCPSCGAGLDINMAGVCAYCDAKITSGDFDWVLSRIEQDESYRG